MPAHQPPSARTLSWVAAACAARPVDVVATERLVGGITADMDRIVVRDLGGGYRHVVLRRWTDTEPWTDGLVEREAAALRALAGHAVGAPRLLAADPSGDRAGVRSLLMSEVPGDVVLAPTDLDDWLERLAMAQARIHAVPPTLSATSAGWFDPDVDFEWIVDAGLRHDAVTAARVDLGADAAQTQTVFAHGDFQHFNVLWFEDRVSGVVDWTMAGTGPRGIDVGHCRLNLAVLFSTEAAETYLDRYERAAGVTVDPRADLRALLCWHPVWLTFIPTQLAGRAAVDLDGMAARVVATIRHTLDRLG